MTPASELEPPSKKSRIDDQVKAAHSCLDTLTEQRALLDQHMEPWRALPASARQTQAYAAGQAYVNKLQDDINLLDGEILTLIVNLQSESRGEAVTELADRYHGLHKKYQDNSQKPSRDSTKKKRPHAKTAKGTRR